MPEIIFSEKEKKRSKYEILNYLYFGPNFFIYLGDCFRAF